MSASEYASSPARFVEDGIALTSTLAARVSSKSYSINRIIIISLVSLGSCLVSLATLQGHARNFNSRKQYNTNNNNNNNIDNGSDVEKSNASNNSNSSNNTYLLQICCVRIILLAPLCSLLALMTLLIGGYIGVIFDMLRASYEGFCISSFLALMLVYVGGPRVCATILMGGNCQYPGLQFSLFPLCKVWLLNATIIFDS